MLPSPNNGIEYRATPADAAREVTDLAAHFESCGVRIPASSQFASFVKLNARFASGEIGLQQGPNDILLLLQESERHILELKIIARELLSEPHPDPLILKKLEQALSG